METIYLLLSAVLTLAYAEVDFCSVCDPPGSHTACIFPKPGPGRNCTKYTSSPLTPEEKELILDIHNRLRSKVARGQGWVVNSTYDAQPKAADMRQLYWDDELEVVAQRWVDQCLPFYTTTPHDECRDSPRFPVGQNIVTSAYSQPMPSEVEARTLDWYNEIKDFNPQWVGRFFQNPNPDPSKQTGHYTQLVWGWTHLLGCGRAIFQEEFEGSKWSVERIVCNYAPGGNFLNFPVYRIGEPCSRCPPGTQCSSKYTGLCALKGEKRSGTESNKETDGGLVIRPVQLVSTTEAPVTWQYWTPGKFWVVPIHLSESPEEAQRDFTPVPPPEYSSTHFPAPPPSPQPHNVLSSTPPPPLPKEDMPVPQRPNPSSLPSLPPSSDPLKEFIFRFTSIPLFNTSKFTSISWVELPKLPPKTLLDLLSSSPSLGPYQMLPQQSALTPQDLPSTFPGSVPNLPASVLLPPLNPQASPLSEGAASSAIAPSMILLPPPPNPNAEVPPEELAPIPPTSSTEEPSSPATPLATSSEETPQSE